jgi:RHS repeat-associated protein
MNLHFVSKNIALGIIGIIGLSVFCASTAMAQTQNTTTYGYDAQGNRTSITDPLGRTTTFSYDALNRLNRTTDPYNGSIKTEFDALDQIRQITDPRNLTTQYGMNNLGDQINLRSPDTGNRSAKYDTGGNMIQQIDARGVTEKRKYDALNRVTHVEWVGATKSATPVVPRQYIYDQGVNGTGRMTGIIDESGHTEFSYDLRGRMLGKVQTVVTGSVQKTFSMSQTFGKIGSATGSITSLTYPSGNRIAFTYDAVGRVRSVTLESNNQSTTLISDISYNHFTGTNGWIWGNGSKWYRNYDLSGRVTHYPLGDVAAGGLERTVVYDAASRIRAMTHTGDGVGPQAPALFDQRFEYDHLNRLTQFTVNDLSQTYLYDANGNRTQVQQGAAAYANDIDPASNRLQRAAGPGGTRNFTYDAEGNIKTDGTLTFGFALHGRMRSISSTAGKTTYWYNALGQRVRKTGQDTTYYFYDGEGRVLGEYDRNGSAIQETVYLNNMPVVMFKQEQGNTVPYYIYADHINTPRVITRASDNAMVWRWDHADPFGAAAPDDSLAGAVAFAYNPRFPGQLLDVESGLHQNYFRDYDPRKGRYVTSDPIGLQGGLNTYAYADGNPLTNFDINGLVKVDLFGQSDDPVFHQRIREYQDVSNECLVYAHGNPSSVVDGRGNRPIHLNAAGLARTLLNAGCRPDMQVTLFSCRTGQGNNSIGEGLTKYFPNVSAPNRQVWFNHAPSEKGPTWFYGKLPDGTLNSNDPGGLRRFP